MKNNRRFRLALGASIWLIFIMSFAQLSAQEMDNNTLTIDADEVLVTTSRTQGDARKSERSVQVITSKEIEETTASNVGDLFKNTPGITLTDTGIAGMKRIRIRGEASSRTLIVIDGIKISEQKSMDGSPLLIDVADIERIEIISGSASVLYGSEAIGGVVNIITKKGGKRPVQAEAGVGYDSSANLITTSGAIYGSEGGFDYRFGGSYADAGERVVAGGEKIPFTEFGNYSFNNYLGYNWQDGGISVRHQTFRSNSNVTQAMKLAHWDRDRVTLGVEQFNLGSLAKLSLSGTWQRSFKDWQTTASQTLNTQQEAHVMLGTDWTLPWENLLIAGMDYSFTFLSSDTNPKSAMSSQKTHEATQNNVGFFIHDKWQILPDFALLAGLRYSYIVNELTKTNDKMSPQARNQANAVVGSFGFLYDIGEFANFRFHYGNGFKNPEIAQTFIASSKVNFNPDGSYYLATILPNPDLKPELSHNFELGFRLFDWGLDLDTAVAYNLGTNYIALMETNPVAHTYSYLNINTAHSFSAEWKLAYEIPVISLSPYFNGSYQYTRFVEQSWSTARTGTPPWQLKGGVRFERELIPLLRLRADANVTWNSPASTETKEGAVTDYKSWYTLNLSTGIAFGEVQNEWVFLNAGVNNLLDAKYQPAGLALLASGRSFFINLTLKI